VVSCLVSLYPPFQTVYHSTPAFIAHLFNQGVAHESIALQILVRLERPTDDSIEIAVRFTARSGLSSRKTHQRHQSSVQYMIEILMQVHKTKYKDNAILAEGLDLVEEDNSLVKSNWRRI
jgi:pre-mRNA-splicing factor CWC22